MSALNALNTQGALDLAGQGLHLVSSPTQIANGTLVWSIDPNYRRANGWGIGFFPGIRAIRRMTPKQVDLGVRSSAGSMDIVIKKWPYREHPTNLKFYDEAMQWAADNIDFEDAKRKPEAEAWKYYTKRTTGGKEPFNQEVHDLTIQSDRLASRARPYRFNNPLKYLELRMQALTLQKQIGEIEKSRQKIGSAEDAIDRIKAEIEKLKIDSK